MPPYCDLQHGRQCLSQEQCLSTVTVFESRTMPPYCDNASSTVTFNMVVGTVFESRTMPPYCDLQHGRQCLSQEQCLPTVTFNMVGSV